MKDAGSSNFVILGRPFTSLRGDRRPDLVGTNVHDFSICLARFNFPSTLVIASIFRLAPFGVRLLQLRGSIVSRVRLGLTFRTDGDMMLELCSIPEHSPQS